MEVFDDVVMDYGDGVVFMGMGVGFGCGIMCGLVSMVDVGMVG